MINYEMVGKLVVNLAVYLLWTCGISGVFTFFEAKGNSFVDTHEMVAIFFLFAWIIGLIMYMVKGAI